MMVWFWQSNWYVFLSAQHSTLLILGCLAFSTPLAVFLPASPQPPFSSPLTLFQQHLLHGLPRCWGTAPLNQHLLTCTNWVDVKMPHWRRYHASVETITNTFFWHLNQKSFKLFNYKMAKFFSLPVSFPLTFSKTKTALFDLRCHISHHNCIFKHIFVSFN